MDLAHILLLIVAGVVAGGINALAGGGSLITFPSLIGTGLPSIEANVTNSVAGSAAGCALLLSTPTRTFEIVVPFLVLGAAAMLFFQERLRGLVGHPRASGPRRRAITLQLVVFAGAVYGGYFGAALGVMYVAVLALVLDETFNRLNALKNILTVTVGAVTLVAFALFGPVDWRAVLVLAPATVVGGYAGATLARRLPSGFLKGLIVTFGVAIGLVLLIRAKGGLGA
jgi:uncharacterized membrane protein YfcA